MPEAQIGTRGRAPRPTDGAHPGVGHRNEDGKPPIPTLPVGKERERYAHQPVSRAKLESDETTGKPMPRIPLSLPYKTGGGKTLPADQKGGGHLT